jgi:hypothetical protein
LNDREEPVGFADRFFAVAHFLPAFGREKMRNNRLQKIPGNYLIIPFNFAQLQKDII